MDAPCCVMDGLDSRAACVRLRDGDTSGGVWRWTGKGGEGMRVYRGRRTTVIELQQRGLNNAVLQRKPKILLRPLFHAGVEHPSTTARPTTQPALTPPSCSTGATVLTAWRPVKTAKQNCAAAAPTKPPASLCSSHSESSRTTSTRSARRSSSDLCPPPRLEA